MKRILLNIMIVSVLLGTRAYAADLAVKAPNVPMAPMPAAYNWAGWYAGGNIGYGWGVPSDPNVSVVDGGIGLAGYFAAGGNAIPDLRSNGVMGGGQIGYNWAASPNWILGVVADFQAADIRAAATNVATPIGFFPSNESNSERLDWFGTVRAKVGFAENNWLPYVTGGLAYGRVVSSGSFFLLPAGAVTLAGANQSTQTGWTVGAGLNYGLTTNWIIGVEYLYVDLGRPSYSETSGAFPGASITVANRAAFNVVRAMLDYKF